MNVRFAILLLLFVANAPQAQECVVLLHGMARSHASMNKLAEALEAEHYQVINEGYPSTDFDIATLAEDYVGKTIRGCASAEKLHFVTHSLGGILVRQYLANHPLEHLGRVVMLGPPNQGSEVVDALKNVPGFTFVNGPAGSQLGTDPTSVPNTLGPVDFPVGVIAGSHTFNPLLSLLLPNPDDGKVSVERTRVKGMRDHIVIPATHTFMMRHPEVIRQTLVFLATGAFDHVRQPAITSSTEVRPAP